MGKGRGQGSEKPANRLTYDGEIAMMQASLNVIITAAEEIFDQLEALKIRREKETDGQFSLT